jgi:hypothetical protein
MQSTVQPWKIPFFFKQQIKKIQVVKILNDVVDKKVSNVR